MTEIYYNKILDKFFVAEFDFFADTNYYQNRSLNNRDMFGIF